MKTRLMTIDDYDDVYRLWANTPGIGINNLDDKRSSIGRYLMRNPKTCFVAEIDGSIVGVILSGHDGRRGYIYNATVHDDYRNRSIGRTLVNNAISALAREGINKASLVVYGENEVGNQFWESLGFTNRSDFVYRNRPITTNAAE